MLKSFFARISFGDNLTLAPAAFGIEAIDKSNQLPMLNLLEQTVKSLTIITRKLLMQSLTPAMVSSYFTTQVNEDTGNELGGG